MADDVLTGKPAPLAGVPRRFWVLGIGMGAVLTFLAIHAWHPEWQLLPASTSQYSAGTLLAVFLAALICEYIDSSLGMGYGTTLTPMLLMFGFDPRAVVPCVLISELVTGLTATLMHHRDGNVDFLRDKNARGTAILLSLLSIVGAVVAVRLANKLSVPGLRLAIAMVIMVTGIFTLATVRRQLRYRKSHIVTVGAIAAFNKGLSGGGYGPLVTAGQVVSGLSPKHAVAISSLAESFVCLVAIIASLWLGKDINWGLALPLAVGAVMSVPLATMTVRWLPEKAMRASVGVMTIVLAIVMLIGGSA
ncbi:MAG: sulfite exporter TauE/SafE family protein [Phycisphaerae bacterium]|nr:sulfite exporter TauE/SafE family protein [Phycisphaerae bacterium]